MKFRAAHLLPTTVAAMAVLIAAVSGCSDDSAAPSTASTTTAGATTGSDAATTTVAATTEPATTAATSSPAVTTSTVPPSEPITTILSTERARTVDDLLAMTRPIVLAHTGGEDAYPGSTLFGFAESVLDGVDVLDLNVVLSGDGVLMVQHDETVDRTTNGTGEVAAMTVAELQALDNAYWFTADCGACTDQPDDAYLYRGVRTGEIAPPDGYTPDDFAIPTLRELVEKYPDLPLNIEIKQTGDAGRAAADALVADLTELDRLDASIVTSFDDAIVDYFHLIAPDVELSPGLNATTAWVLEGTPLPHGMRILQLPPEYQGVEVITTNVMVAAAKANYPVWVWPNNRELENEASYLEFLQMGITGLNINFPAEGVAAVEQFVADTASTSTVPTETPPVESSPVESSAVATTIAESTGV